MPVKRRYKVFFQKEALAHLQKSIDYYNSKKKGLGRRFAISVKKSAQTLESNPFFQIRYDEIRCLPVEQFPFMLHFTVDEAQMAVQIYAVLHTSLNPSEHWLDDSGNE